MKKILLVRCLLFQIGDVVFYPQHGVGIIDCIEEKEINGETKSYYEFHLINNPMKIVLPLDKVENFHVRLISDTDTIDYILMDISNRLANFQNLLITIIKIEKKSLLKKWK